MGKGILLDANGELIIKNKSLVVGDSSIQEVAVILEMNQGEQKFTPLLGANLVELIKSNKSRFEIEKRVKINLQRDGKEYEDIKNQINTVLK